MPKTQLSLPSKNSLHEILKSAKTGMLTTRSADGHLHSRAMIPSSPFTDAQLSLIFIANNSTASSKKSKMTRM
ncbi:hypothetical protein B0H10DRAFT_452845 [Mycena sp. CBHHK59/15]|nr:hypothetical protein B0H10DRAFT_452845 [Mycena sp. CBHHK59/15]